MIVFNVDVSFFSYFLCQFIIFCLCFFIEFINFIELMFIFFFIQFNMVIFRFLMDIYVKKGLVDECLNIYYEFQKYFDCKYDELLMSVVLRVCCNMWCIEKVEEIVMFVEVDGIFIFVVCYNWFIFGINLLLVLLLQFLGSIILFIILILNCIVVFCGIYRVDFCVIFCRLWEERLVVGG